MDVSERLSAADLDRGDYLAASHLHRYGVAASLCTRLRVADVGCGIGYGSAMLAEHAATVTGVDIDTEVVALATAERGSETVSFVAEDALTFLRRAEPADLDAVVMFEALEHVPEVEPVLEQLARLAAGGVKLVLSVPNSRAFHEDNPFHLTDFGYAEARRAFARFEGVEWLFQHLAEGSLMVPAEALDGPLEATLSAVEQGEPEYANTFVVAVGFEPGAAAAASARLGVVATPAHNRYMLELERANAELRRMNRLLARQMYGKHDAAAAAAVVHFDEKIKELETRSWILGEEKRLAEARAGQLEKWHDAARYHAVDRAVELVRRTPVVYPALKGVRRAFRAVRPRGR